MPGLRKDLAAQVLSYQRSHPVLSKAYLPVHARLGLALVTVASTLVVATYCIMANWVYEGYVDLWYGVYGIEDDDI